MWQGPRDPGHLAEGVQVALVVHAWRTKETTEAATGRGLCAGSARPWPGEPCRDTVDASHRGLPYFQPQTEPDPLCVLLEQG